MDSQVHTKSEVSHLELVRSRVEAATNMQQEESVIFIKEESTLAEKAVNILFDNMMISIGDIAMGSIYKVEENHQRAGDYMKVAEAMSSLATVARGLADSTIPLEENTKFEKKLQQEGDNVFAYIGSNFILNGIGFDKVTVLIRPERWQAPMKSTKRLRHSEIETFEHAQPRMTIRAIPTNNPDSTVTIRLDQEDMEFNMEITYDVEVGDDWKNIVDDLEFSDALQRSGHHFSSRYTAQKLGTTFADIMNAFNSKIRNDIQTKPSE